MWLMNTTSLMITGDHPLTECLTNAKGENAEADT
jgi:hypothetical protein